MTAKQRARLAAVQTTRDHDRLTNALWVSVVVLGVAVIVGLGGCSTIDQGRWTEAGGERALERNWRLMVQWESGRELSVPDPLPGTEVTTTTTAGGATTTTTTTTPAEGTVGSETDDSVVVPDMGAILDAEPTGDATNATEEVAQ